MYIYCPVVYTSQYPEYKEEWYVGAFDDEKKAEEAADALQGFLKYVDGYKNLNTRIRVYTLNKAIYEEEIKNYKEEEY